MPLQLMFITNQPTVAKIAEANGVDRVWVDLETMGKEERQKNMDTVKSHHTVEDIVRLSKVLTKAELMVRINPWYEGSAQEVEEVLKAGAQRIMLPMWKSVEEVDAFLTAVNGRARTTLLLETKEAEEIVDEVLLHPLLEEIHIGLNDLHLCYGMTFMFELLANGVVDGLCEKFRRRGIEYGFGGLARIGEGLVPVEQVLMEHYRLGSTRAILSRAFCNPDNVCVEEVEKIFMENLSKIRGYEEKIANMPSAAFVENRAAVKMQVAEIVEKIKESKAK